ncbi:MAG: molybdopterin cofactor-binding domain-containing protein [Chitinophagaceae bacterium]
MKNIDSATHTRGESVYLDDIPLLNGTLFGCAYPSGIANGIIRELDLSAALALSGVIKIFTSKDVTGENQIGGIIPDEPLLADGHVHFCGMPIAFVVATTPEIARAAIKKITAVIDPLPVITDPREAQRRGELIVPSRTFKMGDTATAWAGCTYIFEGSADTNGQEHLYIETQGAYAIPQENNAVKIYSSTQGPTAVQRAVCKVLGVPMHQVEVDVTRLGGGFGGKEDQANMWAALCGLAAYVLKKPVHYSLDRMEDMAMTGKRHPYSSDFKIGLNKDLAIVAYEATLYQNAGAAADLSPAVLERSLFHSTNSYFIPHTKVTAYSCRTNLPPNTAFRGFGGPQGMFVIEAAIAMAAESLGVPAAVIQKANLHQTGDELPYGQKAASEATACWQKAEQLYEAEKIKKEITDFNASNLMYKKGMAFMPVCFGISFTKTPMNQARALVHVYSDGSISISTGAVEMGQGVNTKMLQVAAHVFAVDPAKIRLQTTNTGRIANTSPSAASATADLNGKAVHLACTAILQRLKAVAAAEYKVKADDVEIRNGEVFAAGNSTGWDWNKLVMAAFLKRVSLSDHAHYATPVINFDLTKEKGHPFAYHVYGTAIVVAKVDCLRGIYEIESVKVVHDVGASMNPAVDRGQIEGGIVQGIGWMTMEELVYDAAGVLRSNALSTYKIPDIYSVPGEIAIHFLDTDKDNLAILRSKAVGEPPLMYGIGAYFALRDAVRKFNPAATIPFSAPMTPEKLLAALYNPSKKEGAPASSSKEKSVYG